MPDGRKDFYTARGEEAGVRRSRLFKSAYQALAFEKGCWFLDAGEITRSDSADGLHITGGIPPQPWAGGSYRGSWYPVKFGYALLFTAGGGAFFEALLMFCDMCSIIYFYVAFLTKYFYNEHG